MIGAVAVRPVTRTLEGPAGTVATEPRIMQVLCELADAAGEVVTRETLLARCWPGMLVGDDALNRAIFELRRALAAVGAGVAVETIPKTGYRLAGMPSNLSEITGDPSARSAPSRRWLLAGAGGAAVTGVAVILLRRGPSERERRAAALVERADILRRDDVPDAAEQGVEFYRAALKLTPDDAAAWGKLALAQGAVAEYAAPDATAQAVSATEQAAQRALDLQPNQPDARVALTMLPPHFGGWFAVEQSLRQILADFPDNLAAQTNLSLALMEVGRIREGGAMGDRLVKREPLSPAFQYRHVYQLWARGRLREADQAADQALQLWPRHASLWLSRFWTFALTGRAAAALGMLEAADNALGLPAPLRNLLRLSARACLPERTAGDIAAAIAAHVSAARASQFGPVSAILVLPAIGATDLAFDIVRGYFLRQGPIVGSLERPAGQPAINQQTRRHTAPLWMPSAAPLRADPRFSPLCEAVGLADYWRRSGHQPDFLTP
ncbi:MAG: winged helix-turn-helix domain-containing protein [Proteobacteria bacterium]|nr:winged helix-turn-helix domain-containing protein [Pseudomonadota bacterium]